MDTEAPLIMAAPNRRVAFLSYSPPFILAPSMISPTPTPTLLGMSRAVNSKATIN